MQTGPVRLATPFPPRLRVMTIMIPPYVLSIFQKRSISLTFANHVALADRLATPDAPSTPYCCVPFKVLFLSRASVLLALPLVCSLLSGPPCSWFSYSDLNPSR